jgi:DNA-3-methyladenine glycosylase II
VSLASARSAYEKTKQKLGANFSPASFLRLADDELKSLGFSRQKTAYSRNLANALVSGDLDLNALERFQDEAVVNELTKLKGIGRWTADIYLLMCLRRADVFPVGDLGLIVGAQTVKSLPERLTGERLNTLGEQWRPLRAVATRIIWHYYLNKIRPYKNY